MGIFGNTFGNSLGSQGTLLNPFATYEFYQKFIYGGIDGTTGVPVHVGEPTYMSLDYQTCTAADVIRSNYLDCIAWGTRTTLTIFFYNSSKTFISKITGASDVNYEFIAPTNSAYYRLALNADSATSKFIINLNNFKITINNSLPITSQSRSFIASSYTNTIFVSDYLEDGLSDSDVIDLVLLEAENYTIRTLVFDTKTWMIDKAIELGSNTIVVINNCKIKQNNGVFDNIFRGNNFIINEADPYGYPTDVTQLENISIIGYGNANLNGTDVFAIGYNSFKGITENMAGDNWGWRTLAVYFAGCNNIKLKNIALVKLSCWAITFEMCNGIDISDICIYNKPVSNGDGIDFRYGCKNIKCKNIWQNTVDDNFALNTGMYTGSYPVGKYLFPISAAIQKFKDASDRTIFDIENVIFEYFVGNSLTHNIIFLTSNDIKIKNILIRNGRNYSSAIIGSIYFYAGNTADGVTSIQIEKFTSNNIKTIYMASKANNVVAKNLTNTNPSGVNLYATNSAYLVGVTVIDSTP